MARFGSLFRKESKDEPDREPEGADAGKTRKLKTTEEEQEEPATSTISEALMEIEAETEFPDSKSIEDELIQLELESNIASEETSQTILNLLSEKLTDLDSKLDRLDISVSAMKNRSNQSEDRLVSMEDELQLMLDTLEGRTDAHPRTRKRTAQRDRAPPLKKYISSKPRPSDSLRELEEIIETVDDDQDDVVVEERGAERESSEDAEVFDELPLFKPFGTKAQSQQRSVIGEKLLEIESLESPDDTLFAPNLSELTFVPLRWDDTAEHAERIPRIEVPREELPTPKSEDEITLKESRPILSKINHDYLTLIIVMRWIEFLFERVTRDKFPLLLDYYRDVGWISDRAKSEMLAFARGEMQDVTKYMAHEEAHDDTIPAPEEPAGFAYKKVEDWRLSADDHLRSLLFIMKIAGVEIDKDRLDAVERMIQNIKEDLEGFHGI